MKNRKIKFIVFLFFLCSVLLFAQLPESLLNKPAPYFSAKKIDGAIFSSADFKGKVTLLNFWFLGCQPCMNEIHYLNKINAAYSKKDFQLISIANNVAEDLISFSDSSKNTWMGNVRKSMKTENITYEIIAACDKRKKRVEAENTRTVGLECDNITKDFFIRMYPTTFIIDKKGIVRYVTSGFSMDELNSEKKIDKYREVIDKLLSEPK